MGAIVAGTTHAPLTAILILFELTSNYKIILPLKLACIISTVVAVRIKRESIYTLKLLRRGVELESGKEVNVLKSLIVKDAMTEKVEALPEGMPLKELRQTFIESPYQNYPVLNASGLLVGLLSFQDVRPIIFNNDLEDLVVVGYLARKDFQIITEQEHLNRALHLMEDSNLEMLPVVSPNDPRLLKGVLSRSDIIELYNKAIVKQSAMSKDKAGV